MIKKLFTALFAAFLILECSQEVRAHPEHLILGQFFRYVDTITVIKLDNMLEMTKIYVNQLLDSVPYEHRGNTAEMLQRYIDTAERVEGPNVSVDDKQAVLLELQRIIETVQTDLAKQEQEDLIIRRGLMGMFELLARLSIEDNRFSEKFSRAARLLHSKVAPDGVQRHRELFEILKAIESEQSLVRREELMKRFREIRQREMQEIIDSV